MPNRNLYQDRADEFVPEDNRPIVDVTPIIEAPLRAATRFGYVVQDGDRRRIVSTPLIISSN